MAPHPALGRMDRAVARHGWRIVMITRLVPIFPFNLQNYAYGLTSITFRAYLVTSFVCMLRSEEHTSELQSHLNLVCRLLLEKKKIRSSCDADFSHLTYGKIMTHIDI